MTKGVLLATVETTNMMKGDGGVVWIKREGEGKLAKGFSSAMLPEIAVVRDPCDDSIDERGAQGVQSAALIPMYFWPLRASQCI